jgi:tRNA threonylcarbamoyladenosine biosynthesis protein TsaE
MIINVKNISELDQVAEQIINSFKEERIFALQGDLGAGKTTLIKHLCKFLDVVDVVASPSFSIINEYRTKSGDSVYHFDFYRIKNKEEVMDIGYEEYFYSGNYCFLEWPEKIPELLPDDFVLIKIKEGDNPESRTFNCIMNPF